MKNIFDIHSPFMQLVYKLTDLLWLNLLTLVCSLPVLTLGAAQAGLYCALGRLMKDEGSVTADFFRGFRENFRQATALWLLWLGAGAVLLFGGFVYLQMETLSAGIFVAVMALLILAGALWALSLSWLIPLQVCYRNRISATAKNALMLSCSRPIPSAVMAVINLFPVILWILEPNSFWKGSLVLLLAWFSVAAWCSLKLARRVLDKLPKPSEE